MPPPKESILSKAFYPVGCALGGISLPIAQNYYIKRPFYTGIHRHIALGLIGAVFGYYVDRFLDRKWMERDAVIRHYVELHPEDFVQNKRKYKEIFDEWIPVR
ncbi:NADH dehydrogenase [ubiquinone] 1 subunit C2-like [Stegodyphus dumicola]|uniref:NADH dehydrogenase [ubiquinone] 1 subunit C2-like n=1 Tax=Stegodyphus dumicola TaxID=202533 RepID=UPI0015AF95B0|nr:NADH dehydrogenase [ubiquinone] 1 subunit C2-like [Stegodyphus dumicola]